MLPAVLKFVAEEAKKGNNSILAFGVGPDNKNSSLNIAHIYQAGIGLPERDYYFKTDASTLAIQQAYKTYLATLFRAYRQRYHNGNKKCSTCLQHR